MIKSIFIFILITGSVVAQESNWSFGLELNARNNFINYKNTANLNESLFNELKSNEEGQLKISYPINIFTNYKLNDKFSLSIGVGMHQTGWKSPKYESLLSASIIDSLDDSYSAFQTRNNDYYLAVPIGGIYHITSFFDFEMGLNYSYLVSRQQVVKKWYASETKRETESYPIESNKHFLSAYIGAYYKYKIHSSTLKFGVSTLISAIYLNGETDLGRNFHQVGLSLKYQWNK